MPKTRENVVVWFDIPATDFDRAVGFYEKLLQTELRQEPAGPDIRMAIVPYADPNASGAIVAAPGMAPSANGPVLYLNVDGRLDQVLDAVPGLGGRVSLPRTELPPGMGAFAHIIDSEGNRIGLHQAA